MLFCVARHCSLIASTHCKHIWGVKYPRLFMQSFFLHQRLFLWCPSGHCIICVCFHKSQTLITEETILRSADTSLQWRFRPTSVMWWENSVSIKARAQSWFLPTCTRFSKKVWTRIQDQNTDIAVFMYPIELVQTLDKHLQSHFNRTPNDSVSTWRRLHIVWCQMAEIYEKCNVRKQIHNSTKYQGRMSKGFLYFNYHTRDRRSRMLQLDSTTWSTWRMQISIRTFARSLDL